MYLSPTRQAEGPIETLMADFAQHPLRKALLATTTAASVWFAYLGLQSFNLPAEITVPAVGVLTAMAYYQSTAIGRRRELALQQGRGAAIGALGLLAIGGLLVEGIAVHFGLMAISAKHALGWANNVAAIPAGVLACWNLWGRWTWCDQGQASIDLVDVEPPPAQRAPSTEAADNVFDFTRADRQIAGRSQERHGLQSIYAEAEAQRQAKAAELAAKKDPATGRFAPATKQHRRRKAA